jgi:hypothetical protein
MKPSGALFPLTLLVILLLAVQAGVGLFSRGGPGPYPFTTLHGQTLEMHGQGIYADETAFKAPIYRGSDAVNLAVTVPLLVVALALYRRGSLRGALLLAGGLAMALYNAASLALGAAYNDLFLLYVAFFSASLFAFILAFVSIDPQVLAGRISPGLPRRGIAILLLVAAAGVVFAWLPDLLGALLRGEAAAGLLSSTTDVTGALDLGIIVPTCILTAALLLRRAPLGSLLAAVLLIMLALIGLIVTGQTGAQTLAGITFGPEVWVGKVGSFVVLSLFAMVFTTRYLRSVKEI